MNVTYTFEKLLAAFVDPRIRGVASKGGTRSGKTWATLQMLHLLCSNAEKPLIVSCVAATLPMVKRGMQRDVKLPKDFTRYALRLVHKQNITCRAVHL